MLIKIIVKHKMHTLRNNPWKKYTYMRMQNMLIFQDTT